MESPGHQQPWSVCPLVLGFSVCDQFLSWLHSVSASFISRWMNRGLGIFNILKSSLQFRLHHHSFIQQHHVVSFFFCFVLSLSHIGFSSFLEHWCNPLYSCIFHTCKISMWMTLLNSPASLRYSLASLDCSYNGLLVPRWPLWGRGPLWWYF